MREPSEIERSVRAERVPDGSAVELVTGTPVLITQALGGSFTLLVDGQLVRLRGADGSLVRVAVVSKPKRTTMFGGTMGSSQPCSASTLALIFLPAVLPGGVKRP